MRHHAESAPSPLPLSRRERGHVARLLSWASGGPQGPGGSDAVRWWLLPLAVAGAAVLAFLPTCATGSPTTTSALSRTTRSCRCCCAPRPTSVASISSPRPRPPTAPSSRFLMRRVSALGQGAVGFPRGEPAASRGGQSGVRGGLPVAGRDAGRGAGGWPALRRPSSPLRGSLCRRLPRGSSLRPVLPGRICPLAAVAGSERAVGRSRGTAAGVEGARCAATPRPGAANGTRSPRAAARPREAPGSRPCSSLAWRFSPRRWP